MRGFFFFFHVIQREGDEYSVRAAWGGENGTYMGDERLGMWNKFSQKQEVGASPEPTLIPGNV